LDLVRPEFGWQRFNEIAHELPPLLTEHLREVSSVEISPDWDRYYAWDVNGMLRILTVRDRGTLVGYLFLLLSPHIDSKTTLRAHAEKFWLDPLYRQGWTGVKLFKEAIRAAAEWGAKELSVPVELHIMDGRLENLLKRLGFRPVETIFARRLP
jgi:GNAT superfamily N-acetyltransferase